MPWKEATVMSEKERFVRAALNSSSNMSKLCEAFGISRGTGYNILKRYKKEGHQGLRERSRKPKNSPNATSKVIELLVVSMSDLNPGWGSDKLCIYLEQLGVEAMPSAKTIGRILKRYGRVTIDKADKQQKSWKRFEHERPNDLWQMDFKGHFALKNGRCHPLTLLDDHSRFSLVIKACRNERGKTVKKALIEVFREYGLPKRMTMDNGSPWGYSGEQLYTTLTVWLMRLGIQVSHSRPGHPQTQGKLERFHRTLKLELLSRYYFENLSLAQNGFDWWRRIYNEERPHAAIGNAVPMARYSCSEIAYQEKYKAIEYGEGFEVRKVQGKGEIVYKGKAYLIGKAFYGYPIGLKESEEDGIVDVYFCSQKVLKLGLDSQIK